MVWSARADAHDARAELQRTAGSDALAYLEGDLATELEHHADRFRGISGRLSHPLLSPLELAPVLGRQLSAARHQADAAATGLRTAVTLGDRLRPLMNGGFGSGMERVEALREIEEIARDGRRSFEDLDLGPDRALVSSLSAAREEFAETQAEVVDALDRTASASAGLAEFLEGPSDYLLVAANNAQMQNGQGMFLLAGVLHLEDGRMDLGPMQALAEVPPVVPPVPLDEDLAARWGWLDPNDDLRHLGLSARFPVTGRLASQLWAGLGHPEVDGVLAVDAFMLRAIMRSTGPVRVDGIELGSESVIEYLLHGQYQGYLTDDGDTSYTAERREQLAEIARTALDDLDTIDTVDSDFIDEVRKAATGRHLLLWSSDPNVQAAFEAAGVHGQVTPDTLLLSLVNRSGVKLDWFMRVTAELSVEDAGDGRLEATVDITIRNEAPKTGEPLYVVGPYPRSGIQPGEYLGLVTLTLPAQATDSHFVDIDRLAVAGADGPSRTIAAWVRIPRGSTSRVVARFHLPAATPVLTIEPSARAHATTWIHDDQEWKDRKRRGVAL